MPQSLSESKKALETFSKALEFLEFRKFLAEKAGNIERKEQLDCILEKLNQAPQFVEKDKLTIKPGHISASQCASYLNCGEAYRQRYILGRVFPIGISGVKGRAGHQTAEENFLHYIQTGKYYSLEELQDIALIKFNGELSRGCSFTDKEVEEGISAVKEKHKKMLLATIPYLHEVCQTIKPHAVELEEYLYLKGVSKPIKFVIDLITEDGQVIDFKWSGKAKNQKDVDGDLALTIYSLAYHSKFKKFPTKTSYFNFITYETPKNKDIIVKCNQLFTTRTKEDIESLINRLTQTIDSIENDIFNPAPIGHWLCSKDWCPYFGNGCKYINSFTMTNKAENQLLEVKFNAKQGITING